MQQSYRYDTEVDHLIITEHFDTYYFVCQLPIFLMLYLIMTLTIEPFISVHPSISPLFYDLRR